MNWNTQLIDKLSALISEGMSIKSIVREISIDSILNDFETPVNFPFYLPNKTNNDIDINYRASHIGFSHTEEEYKKMFLFEKEPVELFKHIYQNDIFKYQEDIINRYKDHDHIIVESLRGFGCTEIISFCILHYLIFNYNKSVVIFDNDNSKRIFKQYELLPFYLKPGIRHRNISDNLHEIMFDNGNKITIRKFDEKFKYYTHCDFIFIDKAVYNNDMLTPLIVSLSRKGTKIIFASLANGDSYKSSFFNSFSKIDITEYLKSK